MPFPPKPWEASLTGTDLRCFTPFWAFPSTHSSLVVRDHRVSISLPTRRHHSQQGARACGCALTAAGTRLLWTNSIPPSASLSLSLPNQPSGQHHSGVLINQVPTKKLAENPYVHASQLLSSNKSLHNYKSNTSLLKYI